MKGTNLGEFEEIVLLVVFLLKDNAYAVAIKEELERQTDRPVAISAVHTALYRLEDKGFLNSFTGGATAERGGRAKRYFNITAAGKKSLAQARDQRMNLWNQIPELATFKA